MRIAPIPLQGGVQTIQQSIYLTHDNPCGYGTLLSTEAGDTGLTFNELADILQSGINNEAIAGFYERLRASVGAINSDPSEENVLQYLEDFFLYGKAIWDEVFSGFSVPGYKTVFSCFEANGTTIFDSDVVNTNPAYLEYIPPVYRDGSGDLQYTELILITPQPFTLNLATYNCPTPRSPYAIFPVPTPPPYPPGIPPNPYCVLSLITVQFYGLLQTPSYWPYVWFRAIPGVNINQRILFNSSYMSNQIARPESNMAIASLITDTANTRTFVRPGFGFSSRSYNDGSMCYNACLAVLLTDRPGRFFANLQDIFFVRLTLVKIAEP